MNRKKFLQGLALTPFFGFLFVSKNTKSTVTLDGSSGQVYVDDTDMWQASRNLQCKYRFSDAFKRWGNQHLVIEIPKEMVWRGRIVVKSSDGQEIVKPLHKTKVMVSLSDIPTGERFHAELYTEDEVWTQENRDNIICKITN